jgi:hypothetical protein
MTILTLPLYRQFSTEKEQIEQMAREIFARRMENILPPDRTRPLLVVDNEGSRGRSASKDIILSASR